MTVVATRGSLRLVDDGDGQGHIEGTTASRPLGSFLKWGYWQPVAQTAAATPEAIPGEEKLAALYMPVLERNARRCAANYRRSMETTVASGWDPEEHPRHEKGSTHGGQFRARMGGHGGSEGAVSGEGRGRPDVRFSEATAEEFQRALRGNTRAWNLTEHNAEELAGDRLFLSADGKTGFAITPDGDLQNVFRNPGGVPGSGSAAVAEAVSRGALTLDCYDGYLPGLYREHGFVEVGRMAFDPALAPDGMPAGETPDVVFMAVGAVPQTRMFTDWDEAKRASRAAARGLTAAGEPGEALDETQLTEDQKKALQKAREEIAREAALAQAVQFGISFAVRSPYLQQLVEQHAGKQADRIVEGSRQTVARVITQSLAEGWSVPQTASAIQAKLLDTAPWQATMLARTDLISLKNGGSYAAALALRAQRPVYKQWVSARDDRVRPTHVEANGQVVEITAPFKVGEAQLLYPGDPSGPDEEVINCRCVQIYSDNPLPAVWHVTGAGTWDESQHPRHPEGTVEGGQFAPKGPVGTFKAVPSSMMAGTTARRKGELAAAADKIKALPVPPNNLSSDYGVTPTEEQISAGGFDFYRSSGGAWHLSGPMADGVVYRDTADEIIVAASARLDEAALEGEKNWAARLRGKTYTDRNHPEVMALFREGTAYNQNGEEWTAFAERWGLDEQPILLNEAGTVAMGKDVLTSGWYDPELDRVFVSGDMWEIKNNSARVSEGIIGPMRPGQSGGTTVPGLLRHEYSHKAWAKMSQSQRDRFISMIPLELEKVEELTFYAAASKEYYNGRTFGGGKFPWQGEVFAEAAAATLDPNYTPSDWPDWVNEMGVWIKQQRPQ